MDMHTERAKKRKPPSAPRRRSGRRAMGQTEGKTMKKLLIVVDYQNDFVSGSLGFPGAEELADGIAARVRAYKERGDDVVFTFDTHDGTYATTQEGRNLPVPHCQKGTWGWELAGPVARECNETTPRFEKGAFGSLALANWLAGKEYEAVELVGLVSNICVISNAVLAKAALPEAVVTVDAACTASHDRALHDKTLDVLEGLQITVINR